MEGLVNSLNKDNIKLDGLNRMVCEYARYRLRDADSRGDVSWTGFVCRLWRSGPSKQEHVTEILVPISNSQLQTLRQSSDALVPPAALNDYALIYPNTYLIEFASNCESKFTYHPLTFDRHTVK